MLCVGLIGDDDLARSSVATRFGELGAVVVGTGAETIWDAADPVIVVHNVAARALGTSRQSLQAVLGVAVSGPPANDARRGGADIWLDGTGSADHMIRTVDALWVDRLVPFEANLRAGRRAPRRQQAVLVEPDPTWPRQAARLIGRLRDAVGRSPVRIDHIGSTSVPGLPAKELVDIQVVVDHLASAHGVAEAARRAGFVHVPGPWFGSDRDGADHPEEVVVDADPGRPVNVNIRPVSAPIWRETLLLRDWLRSHNDERDAYAVVKRSLSQRAGRDVDDYSEDKMPWIRAALGRADRWARRVGWSPDVH